MGSALPTATLLPLTSWFQITSLHARSLQTSTCACVIPAGSTHDSLGVRVVTILVDRGAMGRGATASQLLPLLAYPAPHVNPQLVPSQVAVPFVGVTHAVQELPQVLTLLLSAHAPEQAWY